MAHIYLSATHKSSGKTTLSIGLIRELSRRGHAVQPFKKGPDYIDPLWLTAAAGRACLNLDYHTTPESEIRDAFARGLSSGAFGFVEGNVGLFDSVDLQGANSNAALSKLLGAPVVLVVNTQGMTRGIAPLLLGYQAFDPDLRIAGVILNKVGGERHAVNLRRVVEYYTDIPVVGVVPRVPMLRIEERHLGLIPSNEAGGTGATIDQIRAVVAEYVDIGWLERVAEQATAPISECGEPSVMPVVPGPRVRVAIAQDEAFGFYYPDDLTALVRAGAELVPFSPLHDRALPDVDALFIGGGFPECHMQALDENAVMRQSVADFIADDGVAYAECGGLMYLADRLHWKGRSASMCGVIPSDVAMYDRSRGRGYVRLHETDAFPWPLSRSPAGDVFAHEFHHSALTDPKADWVYAYEVRRGTGIDGKHDGIVQKNLLASYAHLRNVGGTGWTERFVSHARELI
ncbi:MAG: cobyrinate a,c-diamide synthase [Thiohalocapsa sp.]